jgi:hypothetical protein
MAYNSMQDATAFLFDMAENVSYRRLWTPRPVRLGESGHCFLSEDLPACRYTDPSICLEIR